MFRNLFKYSSKKAGLLTKVVIFALLIYMTGTLMSMHGRIAEAQANVELLQQQVESQHQRNAELLDAIENSDDPDHRKDTARQRLGLLEPGEKVFYFTD